MVDLAQPGAQLLDGPAGPLEVWLDLPPPQAGVAAGVAVVAHPQPLLGGSAQHKIPALLARALADAGWQVLRPNFRGVGRSAGTYDAGQGEADDLLALSRSVRAQAPAGQPVRLALLGFSFGAFVQARVARQLQDEGAPAWRVVLAGMPSGTVPAGRHYDTPGALQQALVVHGECDEAVPLAQVLDWARPDGQPVVVVPGADHFFSGKLPRLRDLVLSHLRA